MNLRSSEFQDEHRASARRGRDRIRGKPTNLRTLLRWLVREYGMEAPAKLHSGAVLEEDGDPAMTGEAQSWLGLRQGTEGGEWFAKPAQPTDWVQVACGTDRDGFYRTPMRCAIARIRQTERRNLVAELATNLLFPRAVMDVNGIPAWAQNDVASASLSLVWDLYADRPLPRVSWTDKSDAQKAAEDAA